MNTARYAIGLSTSTGTASLAIVKHLHAPCAGSVQFAGQHYAGVYRCDIADYKAQSAELLPRLKQALDDLQVDVNNLAALGVDVGPGGFTSLRTACGIAQGLCTAWNLPAVPVSSFEAMLVDYTVQQGGPLAAVTCAMDARLNELYCAQLQFVNNQTHFTQAPYLLAVSQWDTLTQTPVLCDSGAYALATNPAHCMQFNASGFAVALLAWRELAANRTKTAFECQPLYVRNKVAQTTFERLGNKHGV